MEESIRTVLVLLARCNYCKRIPKKPLVKLGEAHLIEWTLNTMRALPYDGYVFTDNTEVKKIVQDYDLNARDKLYENEKGIHYTSDELKEYNKEMKADIIVLFQLTSPFRIFEDVKGWITGFPNWGVNCALTVRPVQPDVYYDEMGNRVWPVNRTYQNRGNLYRETGSVYIFGKGQIVKPHITLGKRRLLPDPYGFDIDTWDDLAEAENFLKNTCERTNNVEVCKIQS